MSFLKKGEIFLITARAEQKNYGHFMALLDFYAPNLAELYRKDHPNAYPNPNNFFDYEEFIEWMVDGKFITRAAVRTLHLGVYYEPGEEIQHPKETRPIE